MESGEFDETHTIEMLNIFQQTNEGRHGTYIRTCVKWGMLCGIGKVFSSYSQKSFLHQQGYGYTSFLLNQEEEQQYVAYYMAVAKHS